MFSNKRNYLIMKNFLGISIINSRNLVRLNGFSNGTIVKSFSVHSSHSNGESHITSDVHGHGIGNGHNDNHDEHHDDHHGHHEITGEVDLNKVYVPLSSDKSKYISLIGVPNNNRHIHIIAEEIGKATKQITPISVPLITRSRVYFKDLSDVPYEENPYFHPEPYGYLVSDDPFDPNPTIYQTLYVLAIGFIAFMFLTRIFRMNNMEDYKTLSQQIYHGHYTANLIEDEIRRIRIQDYPWRKRYDELKKGESE